MTTTEDITLPENWHRVDLSRLEFIKGKAPKQLTDNADHGYVPYLNPDYLRNLSPKVQYCSARQAELIDDNEPIVLWDGSSAGEVFLSKAGALASTMCKVTTPPMVSPKYLFYFLKSKENEIQSRVKGSGIPHVDKYIFGHLESVFPISGEEQGAIVEILTLMDERIASTVGLISKLTRIKHGLMQDLLTRGIDEHGNIRSEETHKFKKSPLGPIPKEWETGDFDHFEISIIDGDRGEHYPTEKDLLREGYCAFLNNKNIAHGKLVFGETQFITKERDKLMGKGRMEVGDIVLTTRGTVGNIAVLRVSDPNQVVRINSGMVILRGYVKRFTSDFFVYLWSHIFGRQNFAMGSGSAQPQLPIRELRKFCLVKPSAAEQERISSVLLAIDLALDRESSVRDKLEGVKRGLLADLLSGKVRVNHLAGQ